MKAFFIDIVTMQEIEIFGHKVLWQRTRRKQSVGMKASLNGVKLLTPMAWSETKVRRFLKENKAWFVEAVSHCHLPEPSQLLQVGQPFEFLGQAVQLQVIFGTAFDYEWIRTNPVSGLGILKIFLPQAEFSSVLETASFDLLFRAYLERVFKILFSEWVIPKVVDWSGRMDLFPADIQVKHYKARWGSCDAKRRVQFNWRLLFAPEWVAEYVVVHELAHLKHRNHSTSFWQLVEMHFPEYQAAREYLKREGHRLMCL